MALAACIHVTERIVDLNDGLRASFPRLPAELKDQCSYSCSSSPTSWRWCLSSLQPGRAGLTHVSYKSNKVLERREGSAQSEQTG